VPIVSPPVATGNRRPDGSKARGGKPNPGTPVSRISRRRPQCEPVAMFGDEIESVTVTASEARDHVAELEAERALAEVTGVAEIHSYISDLEEELEVWRQLYVISAVTEIATLRGQLSGVQVG
jgi:hypothetical protein